MKVLSTFLGILLGSQLVSARSLEAQGGLQFVRENGIEFAKIIVSSKKNQMECQTSLAEKQMRRIFLNCAASPETLLLAIRENPKWLELQQIVFEYYGLLLRGALIELRTQTPSKKISGARGFLETVLETVWPKVDQFDSKKNKGRVLNLSLAVRSCEGGLLEKKGRRTAHSIMAFYIPASDNLYFDYSLPFFEGFFVSVHELSHKLWERTILRSFIVGTIFDNIPYFDSRGHPYFRAPFSSDSHNTLKFETGYIDIETNDKLSALAPSLTNELMATYASTSSYEALASQLSRLGDPERLTPVAYRWYTASTKKQNAKLKIEELARVLQVNYAPGFDINFLSLRPISHSGTWFPTEARLQKNSFKYTPWFKQVFNIFEKNDRALEVFPIDDVRATEFGEFSKFDQRSVSKFLSLVRPLRPQINLNKCNGNLHIDDDINEGSEGVHPGSEGVHPGSEGVHPELSQPYPQMEIQND